MLMMMMMIRPEDDARRSMVWTNSSSARTVDVRPDVPSTSRHRLAKRVTFVRHAEGYHNLRSALTFDSTYNSSINFDARLTPRGERQCATLATNGEAWRDVALVATSPMTRCVQTSLLAFPGIGDARATRRGGVRGERGSARDGELLVRSTTGDGGVDAGVWRRR